jgi:glycosyltransferase involved in cell wall biosynthesis
MISFVVPAYNEESNIGLCLVAICEEARRRGPYEVIVVDNGSTDKTVEHASLPFYRRRGVRIISEPRKGVVRARQAGYKEAKGDLIANIDADNYIPEGWVANALWEFSTQEDLVLVSGPVVYYEFGALLQFLSTVFYWFGGLFNKFIGPMSQGGNSVIRKSALDKIGGYNTDIDFYGDDTDIAKRISKVGKVKFTSMLWSVGSARRFMHEGVLTTTFRYIANYLSVTIFGKPLHKQYKDIRP